MSQRMQKGGASAFEEIPWRERSLHPIRRNVLGAAGVVVLLGAGIAFIVAPDKSLDMDETEAEQLKIAGWVFIGFGCLFFVLFMFLFFADKYRHSM